MHVVGTAGHVDHGKSTLVQALTGIDPDRLREEKERGMTIDLGFAWLTLPGGEEISIVDVPGHDRFIKNMLAGVGGIDLALLVVAADEGIMPQTVEHVQILELLRIHRAVVAITKVDAVESDWLELVHADVQEYLSRTGLVGAPILPVSALNGEGLPELIGELARALASTPPKPNVGRPRMPVDRVFTVAGFGTVVTGTLVGGELAVGQEVEIVPGAIRARARGLQTHKTRVQTAVPGSRVAVNLVGVSTDQVRRGQVVATTGWLRPTTAVDVNLTVLADTPHPLLHGAVLTFHSGSAEVEARVLLLEGASLAPGQVGWAQLRLLEPVAVVKGDLFVLRSPNATIAGGEIVDAAARRHRRRELDLIAGLQVLQEGSPEEAVLTLLRQRGPLEAGALAERLGIAANRLRPTLEAMAGSDQLVKLGEHVAAPESVEALAEAIQRALSDYHAAYPLRIGMPREELRSRVRATVRVFPHVLGRLTAASAVVDRDGLVRLPDHRVRLSADEEARAARLVELLGVHPYTPPALGDVPPEARLDVEARRALHEQGRIVLIDDDLAFTPAAYAEMRDRVVDRLRERGSVTVADVRDLFGSSRKFVLALLEFLDQRHITRRVGDDRVLH